MNRALASLGLAAIGLVLAGCHGGPHELPITVNSFVDGIDAVPGDGVCEMTQAAGDCSIRAAVDEANAYGGLPLRVVIPAGHYDLALAGVDDSNAGGDLDFAPAAGSVFLDADPSTVVIDGGGLGGVVDLHSGLLLSEGVGVTGAIGPGIRVRAGATGSLSYASVYDNGGAGMQIDVVGVGVLGHVTVSGNDSGGVANDGEFSSQNLTITENSEGGITGAGVVTTLDSTVVADQASGPDCGGPIPSDGFNLDSDGSCGLDDPTDMSGVEASLDISSGGDNPYHQPLVGSDIIDAVPHGTGWCLDDERPLDQLGTGRPIEVGCDRGAVEAENLPAIIVNDEGETSDLIPGDGDCEDAAGNCTLRAAIEETNASPGHEVVAFLPSLGDIVLPPTAMVLTVTDDLTILARGGVVDGSATADPVGVIHVQSGTLRMLRLTLHGGATGMTVDSDAYLVESTITGSVGRAVVVSDDAEFRMLRSTLSRNDGGGIHNSGYVLVRNSTIAENTAPSWGIAIIDSSSGASSDIVSSTIAGNSGRRSAIARGSQPHSGQTRLFNTIVSHQGGGACMEPVVSFGQNFDDDDTCHFHHPDDLATGPAYLTPLADNGGYTETMVPLDTSVVIGAGRLCPPWDQRLTRRPPGQATCDIGAVEGSIVSAPLLDLVVDTATDSRDVLPGDGLCDDGTGACSLRAAVDETNARPTEDRITLAPGISPVLTRVGAFEDDNDTGDIDVYDWVTIDGGGEVLSGLGSDRLLDVIDGGLTVENLTVTGGYVDWNAKPPGANSWDGKGGAIRGWGATVRVVDSVILENGVPPSALNHDVLSGGGIYVLGRVEVSGSLFERNEAEDYGGLYVEYGTMIIDGSEFRDNISTEGVGGGLGASYVNGTITDSTIRGNIAASKGGGIRWYGYYSGWDGYEIGNLLIERSAFLDNTAGTDGAAITVGSGAVLVTDSVFSGNAASSIIHGYPEEGLTIRRSTIAGNTAAFALAGSSCCSGRPLFVQGSIISHTGSACSSFQSQGYNVVTDSSCGVLGSDVIDSGPVVGPLGDHGGPTLSYVPLTASTPVDRIPAGTSALCDGTNPVDQRGLVRPSGSACDVGAVERQPSDP